MPDQTSNGLQCHEFEGLLSDAIDGVLKGAQLEEFQAHARSCSACGPLLAEVEAGRNWLKGLAEVEPPASLVTNILASTTGVDTQRLRMNVPETHRVSWAEHVQAWIENAMQPMWATVRQPRFAMSFGMAFFAISVGLSVLGVKPADLRQISLRPAAIRHTFYNTQARVVRYYDNIRLVYEVQAAASKLKRAEPAEPAPAKPKDHKNDTTEKPEQNQERNYSQSQDRLILASAPLQPRGPLCLHLMEWPSHMQRACGKNLPVVPVTTYRRMA